MSPPGAPRAAGAKGHGAAAAGAAARAPGAARSSAWRVHLPTLSLAVLGLVLYGRGLLLGYVGDDYKLLDAALRYPLGELLSGRHGILGYYRPVSRELYFWLWGRMLGLGPGGFHLVNAITFAAVVVMIDRLGRAWAGARAGRLAAVAFLLFPPGSALLSWISCAQDLIMLFWAAAALLLYARGRHRLCGLATALAVLSKETAVVLPLALVVMDGQLHPGEALRARAVRLAPPWLGLALAGGLSLAARSTWPASTAVTVWSPGQFAQAWRLPIDFLRALFPPDTGAGIAQAMASQPVWVGLVLVAAVASVPWSRRGGPSRRTGPQRAPGATGAGDALDVGRARSLVIFGLALAVLAMLPVGFVSERWRSYFFSLSAIGGALAAGVGLVALPALATPACAFMALINFGAGGIYRPVESASGPARHPHVNYAFFRDTGALSAQILNALAPWCASIRAVPRTFAAGLPPDEVFATAFGPGLRVACRDTAARVRFLAEFEPADAAAEFGVLRFDARSEQFVFERSDRRVRARVGEGFLIHARFDVAAACFEAAARESLDRELSYPLAISLAAAGRDLEARARWAEAQRTRQVLDPRTMAERLAASPGAVPTAPAAPTSAGAAPAAPASDGGLEPLAAQALRSPWEVEPHRALGRALLERGHAREATLELAAAAGISHQNADLAILARGYEAMGLIDEAVAGYRRVLAGGLPSPLYEQTRDRLFRLMQGAGASLDRSVTHP